ncbi:DNA-binding protein [Hydrocarboniphaga effusa]|uniref:DNA-binding protein n=1 Tax=Hydrocarboniphaga effusa TaxID=243629 RepID=UPI0035AF6A27
MRTGVTLVDITRAADQLLADGERPTIDGIRKFLGTGSPATVNALLKEYYQALPGRLNLPAPIATAAAELYEKVRSTAMEEVTEQRVDLERQIALEREQIAQERRAFEAEKNSLRSQAAALTNDVERLHEQARQATTKIAGLEKDVAGQAERAATAEAQARAADEERERSGNRHAAELQRLREQAEGNERHFLSRIEEQKTQHQRLQSERDRESAAANKRTTELESSLSEALKSQASLRAELAAAQRDLGKYKEATQLAQATVERLQTEAIRAEAAHRASQEKVQSELDQSRRATEQHGRDRDDAVREAARSDGKLQAFQIQLEEARAEILRLHRSAPEQAGPARKDDPA